MLTSLSHGSGTCFAITVPRYILSSETSQLNNMIGKHAVAALVVSPLSAKAAREGWKHAGAVLGASPLSAKGARERFSGARAVLSSAAKVAAKVEQVLHDACCTRVARRTVAWARRTLWLFQLRLNPGHRMLAAQWCVLRCGA